MKLSSKLPARNGLTESALERELLRAPTKSRWLIAEVVCGKIETTFDEFGDPYQTATAQLVAGEYITAPSDLTNIRMISRRAFDQRRGSDTLPGVDGLGSSLQPGESITIGKATIHGSGLVNLETGEIDEDHDA